MQQAERCPRKFQIGFYEGACPLKCNKCLAFGTETKEKKKISKMTIENARNLIDEIAGISSNAVIQPHIYAEPFANPDLKQIIQYCGEKRLAMSIITNGILLDNTWLDFLLEQYEQKITISFSLDAVTQEVYEKVRGKYELKQIEDNIMYLLDNRRNKNLRIGVNFVIEDDNKEEQAIFLDKWKYVVDAVRISTMVGRDKKAYRLEGLVGQKDLECEKGCNTLYEIMVIDTDGTVRACTLDAFAYTNLGNVFEDGIKAVWSGSKIASLRKKLCLNQLSEKEFCYGCEAYKYTGAYIRRTEGMFDIAENGYQIYYNHR